VRVDQVSAEHERSKTTVTVAVAIALLVLVILGGCAFRGPRPPQPANLNAVLKGTVNHHQRIALPRDAVVEIWITNASPLMLAVPVIGQTVVLAEGRQLPIPFELRYDGKLIDPEHAYAVKAVVRDGGEILFATTTDQLVITKGNPSEVELLVTASADTSIETSNSLAGTSWRLESLGGADVQGGVDVTLEFLEGTKVAGIASCNRFFGTADIAGTGIRFSPLGATRIACPDAVMDQENKYLAALQNAERFTLQESTLLIHFKGTDKPLRFIRNQRQPDGIGS
jgi:putative lipoprotein